MTSCKYVRPPRAQLPLLLFLSEAVPAYLYDIFSVKYPLLPAYPPFLPSTNTQGSSKQLSPYLQGYDHAIETGKYDYDGVNVC
jgi:hypothetical protein